MPPLVSFWKWIWYKITKLFHVHIYNKHYYLCNKSTGQDINFWECRCGKIHPNYSEEEIKSIFLK